MKKFKSQNLTTSKAHKLNSKLATSVLVYQFHHEKLCRQIQDNCAELALQLTRKDFREACRISLDRFRELQLAVNKSLPYTGARRSRYLPLFSIRLKNPKLKTSL